MDKKIGDVLMVADVARSYGVSQATISRLDPRPFGRGPSVGAVA
jgi:hypothetical protein